MVIVLTLYLGGVYLIFFKWKLLPFNKFTGGFVVVLGVTILTVFLVGLQTLTPASVQGMISVRYGSSSSSLSTIHSAARRSSVSITSRRSMRPGTWPTIARRSGLLKNCPTLF